MFWSLYTIYESSSKHINKTNTYEQKFIVTTIFRFIPHKKAKFYLCCKLMQFLNQENGIIMLFCTCHKMKNATEDHSKYSSDMLVVFGNV